MKGILILPGLLLLAAPLWAQTAPTGVAFDVNPTEHSTSVVSGYKIYVLISSNTVRVSDIGKPAPDDATVSYVNPDLFAGLAAGSYTVHTTAYGPGGESIPSNKASFSIGDSEPAPSPPSNTEPTYDDPSGTPAHLLVEAEHFDNGGQGVAYYDTSPGNEGGRTATRTWTSRAPPTTVVATTSAGSGGASG